MTHHVKHFLLKEFDCPCCGKSIVAVELVFWLDVFRRAIGKPLQVNSGYRCEPRNKFVYGSEKSRHMIGCAADLAKPARIEYADFSALARRLAGDGWEIETYPSGTYIHIAVPRAAANKVWTGERDITI